MTKKLKNDAFESLKIPPIQASNTLWSLLKMFFFIFIFLFTGLLTYTIYSLTESRPERYNDLKNANISSWVGPSFIALSIIACASIFYVLQCRYK